MTRRGLLAIVLVAAAAAARGEIPTTARILVMPFENVTRDGRIFWLTEASAVLMADDLNALGAGAITREERREAFERLQVPPAAALTDATIIRIGQLVGAAQVVIGSLEMAGDTLIVRASAIELDTGRIRAMVVERGSVAELFGTFERVARGMLPPSTRSSEEIERQHPPVAAFEDYIKGLVSDTPATALNYLNAALRRHPAFDRVRLALWEVYTDQGEHQRALVAVEPIGLQSPWSRRARFLAGLSQLRLKKYEEAFSTFKALADAHATAPVLNNLGVVQLRRTAAPQTGLPTYYFHQAAQTDADDEDCLFNLGYAYWLARDPQAAIYWLREAVRRNPADGDAHFVLGVALSAGGNAAEASRERELARRLSSMYEEWEKRPAAEMLPKGLERVKSDVELPHARRVEAALSTAEARDQRELAQFYLDRGRRLFEQENDREAMAELNRALYLQPYQAEAHVLVGRIHLRNGRVREAIDALKIALWSEETPQAHVMLGEAYLQAKDERSARAEAERALALAPASIDAKRLLDRVTAR